YTPHGGTIAVMARGEGSCVRVGVRDTGIGLTPEEQARLFTKFFRAKHPLTRTVGGTGLGLAITRLLLELHGGGVAGAGPPGGGAVDLKLPPAALPDLIQRDSPEAASSRRSRHAPGSNHAGRRLRRRPTGLRGRHGHQPAALREGTSSAHAVERAEAALREAGVVHREVDRRVLSGHQAARDLIDELAGVALGVGPLGHGLSGDRLA